MFFFDSTQFIFPHRSFAYIVLNNFIYYMEQQILSCNFRAFSTIFNKMFASNKRGNSYLVSNSNNMMLCVHEQHTYTHTYTQCNYSEEENLSGFDGLCT